MLTAAAALLAGCGSSAVRGPNPGDDSDPQGQTADGQQGQTGGRGRDRYEFRLLPVGDRVGDEQEERAYDYLLRHDCDAAQRVLGAPGDRSGNWQNFDNPRNVLLFQAGVHLCHGDSKAAGPYYTAAGQHGWAATDNPAVCQLYKAVASVLEQRPRRDFACQGGDLAWPDGGQDDPRTPEDESTGSPDEGDGEGDDGGASPDAAGDESPATGDGDGAAEGSPTDAAE